VDKGLASVPTISGTAADGQVLTASFADDDPNGPAQSIAYQWLQDGSEISGATNDTYTIITANVGHKISVRVDYVDAKGFAGAVTSAETATVAATNSGNASAPTISGTRTEGQTLTANFANDDPDGAGTVTGYQWNRNGSPISGATSQTYALQSADVGTTITVTVTYTDGEGFSASVTSASAGTISAVTAPSIVNASTFTTSAATLTPAAWSLPGSRVNGNILILFAYCNNSSMNLSLSGAGWNLIDRNITSLGNNALIAWRVIDGTEAAPSTTSSGSSFHSGQIFQVQSANAAPIGAERQNEASNTAISIAAINTTKAKSLIMAFLTCRTNQAIGTPSGFTQASANNGAAGGMQVASQTVNTSGAASSAVAVTIGSSPWTGFLVEIKSP
jgi:hypothetical protein